MPRRLLGVVLLLLATALKMQAQGEVVLYIGDRAVDRSEFAYHLSKSKHTTAEAYLPSFIDYKLKVLYAKEKGVDTLPAFKRQFAFYQNKLLRAYLVDTEKEEREARLIFERCKQRLPNHEQVQLAHITKYLPQQVDRAYEQETKRLMDSLYAALQEGADFAALARTHSDDTESGAKGGVLPWMPVNKHIQEWIDKLTLLEQDKVSPPFYSPLGIHLVKWIGRKSTTDFEESRAAITDFIEREDAQRIVVGKEKQMALLSGEWAQQHPELSLRIQELYEGLLVAAFAQTYKQAELTFQASDLEHFFKHYKDHYAWGLPHYKGAVIHCKDKKAATALKKQLKKKPIETWEALVQQLIADKVIPSCKIEAGLFAIGKNKYIDKLVFNCGSFEENSDLPYTFVIGKKLKKGLKSYWEAKEEVISAYRTVYRNAWLKELKQKYKVEINEEVLKTVNNDGRN